MCEIPDTVGMECESINTSTKTICGQNPDPEWVLDKQTISSMREIPDTAGMDDSLQNVESTIVDLAKGRSETFGSCMEKVTEPCTSTHYLNSFLQFRKISSAF